MRGHDHLRLRGHPLCSAVDLHGRIRGHARLREECALTVFGFDERRAANEARSTARGSRFTPAALARPLGLQGGPRAAQGRHGLLRAQAGVLGPRHVRPQGIDEAVAALELRQTSAHPVVEPGELRFDAPPLCCRRGCRRDLRLVCFSTLALGLIEPTLLLA
jgi:hypothetical protein